VPAPREGSDERKVRLGREGGHSCLPVGTGENAGKSACTPGGWQIGDWILRRLGRLWVGACPASPAHRADGAEAPPNDAGATPRRSRLGVSEPLSKREPVGARLDGDVLEHRVAARRGQRGVALAVARVDAPAAPGHHALAVEESVDREAEGAGAADKPLPDPIPLKIRFPISRRLFPA